MYNKTKIESLSIKKINSKILILGILLIGTLIIGPYETSSVFASKHHNTQSVKPVDPILCYAAGGLLLLGGVPATEVIGAGQAAHSAGVCP